MAITPFSVSQVNDYISRIFKTEPLLRPVVVKGEISYLNYHSNGNIYLSISDQRSKLDCVIFSNRINEISKNLTQGDEIICAGNIEAFPAQSKYSLWVNDVELVGEGNLAIEFEKLKKKLYKEGLFDQSHKKELPPFPKHIGVITSKTGAAVKDILKILTDRTSLSDITVFPVLVQGPSAAADMIQMLDIIERDFIDTIDLLIIGRGGGSNEDLAVFNDEGLARAIYACTIPIISAVGHEIDTTISDYVADLRAETPTAAAQIAVRKSIDLRNTIDTLVEDMNRELRNKALHKDFQLESAINEIKNRMRELILINETETERALLILKENDPRKYLEKGYAMVSAEDGTQITSSKKIKKNQLYTLYFKDGESKVRGE